MDKKLCTCGKCGLVYQDTDPDTVSNNYPAELITKFNIKELKDVKCPVCKTDAHLRPDIKPLVWTSKRIYQAWVKMSKENAM